jgi:tape measure domain-containing protein
MEEELTRMIIRLVGDASEYERMFQDATAAAQGAYGAIGVATDVASEALARQLNTYGMSSRELDIYMMKVHGASQEQIALAESINEELTARERQSALYAQGTSLTQQMRTSTEVYRDRMAELKQLLDSGSISQETFNRAAAQAKSAMSSATVSTEGFRKGLEGVRSAAYTTQGILASAGLSFGLIGTAIKSVQLAGQFEAMTVDLEVLAGNAEKARGMIEELNVFAAKTPFELPGLMNSTKMLMQFGVESDQIVPLLKLLGNAAGGSQQKLDQLSLAFGHAASQGKLTGYSMRQMIFAGFNPLREIHNLTGRGVPELTEDLHKGKIGIDILVAALNNASKAGGTFEGRLERASTTLTGLFSTMKDNIGFVMREIGGIIIEGLDLKGAETKISDAAIMITNWLKNISPEAKRVIAIILAVVAGIGVLSFALFALGPVISLIGTVLAPVISLLGLIPALIGFLLSPIGMVVVAIGGLVAAFLYFTDAGSQMATWFGKTLATIKDFFMPAIKGIKDAITAGDITLAFEILWAQIKLTFSEGIKPLKELWIGYVFFLKEQWANAGAAIQSTWDTMETGIASGIVWLGERTGVYTKEQAAAINQTMANDNRKHLKEIERDRKNSVNAALNEAADANKEISAQLAELYKKRDELVNKAKGEAGKDIPLPVEPKLDPNKFKPPDQKMKVTPEVKWEASLAEGAEAVSRMIAYGMNLVGFGPGLGAHGGHGAGGVGGGMGGEMGGGMGMEGGFGEGPNPIQAGGMEDDPARDKMVSLLGEVANNTGTMAKKPGINIATANL